MKHRSLRNDPRRRICTSEFTKPLPSGRDGQASIVGNCLTSRSNRSSFHFRVLDLGLDNRGASGLVHGAGRYTVWLHSQRQCLGSPPALCSTFSPRSSIPRLIFFFKSSGTQRIGILHSAHNQQRTPFLALKYRVISRERTGAWVKQAGHMRVLFVITVDPLFGSLATQ